MLFFRNKKKKYQDNVNKTFIALDIGTEFVKTAICRERDSKVEVIGFNRTRQENNSMYAAFIVDMKTVVSTVDASIGEAIISAKDTVGDNFTLPNFAVVGIAGELIRGVVVEGKVSRKNHNIPISSNEIKELKERLSKEVFESTKSEISEELGIKCDHLAGIDTYLNSVYVDGLKVIDPVGYTASEIGYKIFTTFGPKIQINTIKNILEKIGISNALIVVEPYALTLSIKNLRNIESNGIVIDIGGGTTDIAVVQKGEIVGTSMFALAGKMFTKSIQKELNVSYLEAEEIKIKYSKNELDNYTKNKVSTVVQKNLYYWLVGLEILLKEYISLKDSSTTFYICGGGALLKDLQDGLLYYPWTNKVGLVKQPRIDLVFPNSIDSVVDLTKQANNPSDIAVLSLANFYLYKSKD